MDPKIGQSHMARKELFRRGVSRGFLTVSEIEGALPPGAMAAAERWLLYYSLRAAEIEIVADESDVPGSMDAMDALDEESLELEGEGEGASEGEEANEPF